MKILTDAQYAEIIRKGKDAKEIIDAHNNDIERIDKYRDAIDFAFNFKDPTFKVFSIERENLDTANERTDIAYIIGNQYRNWYFECSRRRHNELVKEWKESLKPLCPQ